MKKLLEKAKSSYDIPFQSILIRVYKGLYTLTGVHISTFVFLARVVQLKKALGVVRMLMLASF